jgi:tetratricopeptide (TPR) repeat protein
MATQTREPADDSPKARAQAMLDQARKEPDARRRVRLAHDALAVWADCADAHVLLADHAATSKEALRHYERGVAAGERSLGPGALERDAGRFWRLGETRPYMRARLGLAHALWTAGRREEAVGHLQDLLRLNPDDHQSVRYTLAGFLLFLDRDDDLAQLLRQYGEDDSAAWAYTRALLAFRQQGDTIDARRLLKAGKKTNKHVPDYLLGRKIPPAGPPGRYRIGDESEALNYIGSFLAGWKSTAGAVAWLRANAKVKNKAAEPTLTGPLGFVKNWLKGKLPQAADVWQADARQMPSWLRIAGDPVRPWALLVTSRSHDLVLGHQMPPGAPSAALLWDTLLRAMQHPAAGEPHRPTELQVRPHEHWESLRPHLEEVGVTLVVRDALEHLDAVFHEMCERVCGKPRPGLLDQAGVTPALAGRFYEAAAFFFRQAPWKQVGHEATVRVECDALPGGPWYAILMGQSGLTTGLALYDDLNALRRMWSGIREEEARQVAAVSVTFGEEWEVCVADLEAAAAHGWELARPDAHPAVLHTGPPRRLPPADELELLAGCLRAVPSFVARHRQGGPAREAFPAAAGGPGLVLSWAEEEGA